MRAALNWSAGLLLLLGACAIGGAIAPKAKPTDLPAFLPLPTRLVHEEHEVFLRSRDFYLSQAFEEILGEACSFRVEPPQCWAKVDGHMLVLACDEQECRPIASPW